MIDYFRSDKVQWKQGLIQFQRVTWHSCAQWGWPRIDSGERLARWRYYYVLSIKWKNHGVCWQWWPNRSRFLARPCEPETP